MKFTRKQELVLIELGLKALLNGMVEKPTQSKTKGRRWTKTQRAKFSASMQKKWNEKKKLPTSK